MFEQIEKLRGKSERVKKQIAFLVSFAFVGVIGVVWLSVVFPDLKNQKNQEARVSKVEPSPISAFSDAISSGMASVSEEITGIKSALKSFTTEPAYFSATSTEKN